VEKHDPVRRKAQSSTQKITGYWNAGNAQIESSDWSEMHSEKQSCGAESELPVELSQNYLQS